MIPRHHPAPVPLDEGVVAVGRVVAGRMSARVIGDRRRGPERRRCRGVRPGVAGSRVADRRARPRSQVAQPVIIIGQRAAGGRPASRAGLVDVGLRTLQPPQVVVAEEFGVGCRARPDRASPEQSVAAPVVGLVLELGRALHRVDARRAAQLVEGPRGRDPVPIGLSGGVAPGVHRGARHQRRRSLFELRQVAPRVVLVANRQGRWLRARGCRSPQAVKGVAARHRERVGRHRRIADRRRRGHQPLMRVVGVGLLELHRRRCRIVVSAAVQQPTRTGGVPAPARGAAARIAPVRDPSQKVVRPGSRAAPVRVCPQLAQRRVAQRDGREVRVAHARAVARVVVAERRSVVGASVLHGHRLQEPAPVVGVPGDRPVRRNRLRTRHRLHQLA